MKKGIYSSLFILILGVGIYILSLYHYLLYHIFIELVLAVLGILIFTIAHISRPFVKNNIFTFAGPAFLMTSLIGIVHTLAFKGMNLFPGYSPDLATQLWVVENYLLAFAFLFSAICFDKKINYWLVFNTTAILSILGVALCFAHLFPVCMLEGPDQTFILTPFKRASEFLIILIYVLTLVVLPRKKLAVPFYKRTVVFIGLLILSGLAFAANSNIYGPFNYLGHYIKVVAFVLFYYALYYDLVLPPYKKVIYDSIHDTLTGLYNRKYFFQILEEQEWISPGIIIFDINGLKLVNHTFGFAKGDELIKKAAEIIHNSVSNDGIVAYTSGGEFSVVIDQADKKCIDAIMAQFYANLNAYNNNPGIPLSFSHGYFIDEGSEKDKHHIYHKAVENMQLEKMLNNNSRCSTLVKTLLKTLETKDLTTKDHVDRTANLAAVLALKSGIPENRLNQIVLLAEFHDIGKIGVSDKILLKPGPLTYEERLEMQQHSKLGYEIAIASVELATISDYILKHHERWDGKGYPFGLKGEEIPLECRIISIIDAYDAMSNDRPYRKALSKEEIIAEFKRCAGTQFDPHLVELFLEIIQ